MLEDLLESLPISSSPESPATPSSHYWPELMEEPMDDWRDDPTTLDERNRRALLEQEQDGALWSA